MNKNRTNSDLVYNSFNFNRFSITNEEFNELPADTKHKYFQKFFNRINELRKVKSRTLDIKRKKIYFD